MLLSNTEKVMPRAFKCLKNKNFKKELLKAPMIWSKILVLLANVNDRVATDF